MDFLDKMYAEWKKEMVEAGWLESGTDLSNEEIQKQYQEFMKQQMKSALGGMGIDIPEAEGKPSKAEQEKAKPEKESRPTTDGKQIGGESRSKFIQMQKDLEGFHSKIDTFCSENREVFDIVCDDLDSEFLGIIKESETWISDQSTEGMTHKDMKKQTEKKMKEIRKSMERILKDSGSDDNLSDSIKERIEDYSEKIESQIKEIEMLSSELNDTVEEIAKLIAEMEVVSE